MQAKSQKLILATDIGGTNLNMAIAETDSNAILWKARYPTRETRDLRSALERFMNDMRSHGIDGKIIGACLAGAGVVSGNVIDVHNVPWPIRATEAEGVLGIPVTLANDFTALTFGIASSDPENTSLFTPLHHPSERVRSPIMAVVGAGTGFGMGYAVLNDDIQVFPSEGGNTRFPVWDGESENQRIWTERKLDRASCAEDWVSGTGIGLALEYEYAARKTGDDETVEKILAHAPTDRSAQVSEKSSSNRFCARVMDRFIEAYAVCASDAALMFMPSRLYIAGGIAMKNASRFLDNDRFMGAFLRHGKAPCRELLRRVEVYLVRDYDISLIGSVAIAVQGIIKKRQE